MEEKVDVACVRKWIDNTPHSADDALIVAADPILCLMTADERYRPADLLDKPKESPEYLFASTTALAAVQQIIAVILTIWWKDLDNDPTKDGLLWKEDHFSRELLNKCRLYSNYLMTATVESDEYLEQNRLYQETRRNFHRRSRYRICLEQLHGVEKVIELVPAEAVVLRILQHAKGRQELCTLRYAHLVERVFNFFGRTVGLLGSPLLATTKKKKSTTTS